LFRDFIAMFEADLRFGEGIFGDDKIKFSGYLGFFHEGVFLEDCMVRYAHQFPFIPHMHDQGVGEIPPGRPPDMGFEHTIEFGLPRIDELRDELHGAVYLYDINLCLGYHQIRMREKGVRVHQEEIQVIWDWLTEISADWKSHLLVEYSKDWFACKLMDGHIQDDIGTEWWMTLSTTKIAYT
jgi:hypothetical protein